jgi:hypothetical protein
MGDSDTGAASGPGDTGMGNQGGYGGLGIGNPGSYGGTNDPGMTSEGGYGSGGAGQGVPSGLLDTVLSNPMMMVPGLGTLMTIGNALTNLSNQFGGVNDPNAAANLGGDSGAANPNADNAGGMLAARDAAEDPNNRSRLRATQRGEQQANARSGEWGNYIQTVLGRLG